MSAESLRKQNGTQPKAVRETDGDHASDDEKLLLTPLPEPAAEQGADEAS
ncbi:hypothetical protein [Actinomadura gamaensis]|uniref:Uncharacterized protein n=1 Tax=Actinomadura gamaensis TaxID=1763541 RepID=A0ABV9U9U1_9ACTN